MKPIPGLRLALPVAFMIMVAGCGGGTKTAGDAGGAYAWGIDAELSGQLSFYGQGIVDGVTAYVDGVNASGGINGHKIELTSLDDAGEQSRAAANATQLATVNKVSAIFGHTLSTNCSAAQPIIERYKTPMACLSVAAASPYIFSLGPDNSRAGKAMFAAAKKVTSKSNVRAGLIYPTTQTGTALGKAIESGAASNGFELTSSQAISLTATDLSTQISRLVAGKPDVVFISHTGPGLLNVLKGARAGGLDAPFVWVDGTGNMSSLATSTDAGVYALNIYEAINPATATDAAKEYVTAVTPKLKNGVTVTSVNGGPGVEAYLTARAFGTAMKACGYPCPGDKLRGELEKVQLSLPGLVASFRYTADDHYPYPNWYLYHVVGAELTLVDTIPA